MSIAAISMGGTMCVGVIADPDKLPDPDRLARAIEHTVNSFEPARSHAEMQRTPRAGARRAA